MLARRLIFGAIAACVLVLYAVLGARLYATVAPMAVASPRPTPPRVEVAAPRLTGAVAMTIGGDIFVLRDGRLRPLTQEGRSQQPALSADGGTVVFSRRGQIDGARVISTGEAVNAQLNFADIVMKPALGGEETVVLAGLRQRDPRGFHRVSWYHSPALSPDGRRLAYIEDAGAGSDLHVMDLASRRITAFSRGALLSDVAWSPDGATIVTTSYANTQPGLLLWNADRPVAPRRVADLPAGEPYGASFSTDGRWLIFTLRNGNRNDLHALEVGTTRTVALTNDGRSWNGVFSADGGSVAFLHERGGTFDVYAMPLGDVLTGGSSRPTVKLTAGQGIDGPSRPSWSR